MSFLAIDATRDDARIETHPRPLYVMAHTPNEPRVAALTRPNFCLTTGRLRRPREAGTEQ